MFGKKKQEPTSADLRYRKLWDEIQTSPIRCRAQDVITKLGVVDLYPEGPDKEAAKKEAEASKHRLLCAIGHYDATLAELKMFWDEHRDELEWYYNQSPYKLITSHVLIEWAYQDFFNK